jgi:hypothetical protein
MTRSAILPSFGMMLVAAVACAAGPWAASWENAKIGQLPPGWTAARTGTGSGSVWEVVEDATAPHGTKVLAQVSDQGPNHSFNLCVAANTRYADVDVSVAFKAVAGKLDQGGGLVWRYRDANNYYIARMNPLEDNFRVYKVVAGKRIQLATADVKAAAGQWYTVRVVQRGAHIRCDFDGRSHLEVDDATFPDAGRIGLWSKADAQTRFADLRAR